MTLKIAILKIGSRIAYGSRDTSGGNGETRSIINLLVQGGCEVHAYTKILKTDTLVDFVHWHQMADEYKKLHDVGYDALIVLNGNVNYFGGQDDPEQTLIYDVINKFDGRVFYILCDPALQLKQIWPSVERKPWASNYSKEQLEIVRNDIIYICQPFNADKLHKEILPKNKIEIEKCIHFPFEKFPCMCPEIIMAQEDQLTFDLSYGGTMRGGKREKKMIDFYFGYPDDIKVEMFGKIELEDFNPKKTGTLRPPVFSGAVKYDDYPTKVNRTLSTVVIGDPLYEELSDINQRAYESIWANVITFVDKDFDKQKRVYGDHVIGDLLYVDTRDDVVKLLNWLKSSVGKVDRESILAYQKEAIDFDARKYVTGLTTIIGDNVL
jgi:hypothetical protein